MNFDYRKMIKPRNCNLEDIAMVRLVMLGTGHAMVTKCYNIMNDNMSID